MTKMWLIFPNNDQKWHKNGPYRQLTAANESERNDNDDDKSARTNACPILPVPQTSAAGKVHHLGHVLPH